VKKVLGFCFRTSSSGFVVSKAWGLLVLLALLVGGTPASSQTTKAYSWGNGFFGQLGNGTSASSSMPMAVKTSGALAGKTIIALAAGGTHSLALASDGKIYAWGLNSNGQLGNNSQDNSLEPVAVTMSGALAGKTIIAVAAGGAHSLALASDGKIYAWGFNGNGQLGNNSQDDSLEPVAVTMSGALAGKTIIAVVAGGTHNLALASDGNFYAWGYNANGQLGNNSPNDCLEPTAVTMSGALAGKTVVAVAAGGRHSVALASDGKVYAWGHNGNGQLGNSFSTDSWVPVPVTMSGALAGKTVVAVAAGGYHSVALASDGKIYTWGDNGNGQLGNNSTDDSLAGLMQLRVG